MKRYAVEIRVTPRPGILDPEGKAIQHALSSLGYSGTLDVRVGKLIQVDLRADTDTAALETGRLMCRRLLANPVTEDYDVRLLGDQEREAGGKQAAEPKQATEPKRAAERETGRGQAGREGEQP